MCTKCIDALGGDQNLAFLQIGPIKRPNSFPSARLDRLPGHSQGVITVNISSVPSLMPNEFRDYTCGMYPNDALAEGGRQPFKVSRSVDLNRHPNLLLIPHGYSRGLADTYCLIDAEDRG